MIKFDVLVNNLEDEDWLKEVSTKKMNQIALPNDLFYAMSIVGAFFKSHTILRKKRFSEELFLLELEILNSSSL